ncbi:MAG: hypothetical protein D8M58_13985 [Calditrichaeota bacterium]|nr:MAG: hypothetical protein DWQ03_15225 [Calditrichota bacterium]MBL1206509.1 hypothetical protein [Calditrichota bacterium]NOG46337.1 hypothetical protein [Calditrichota bacterium]
MNYLPRLKWILLFSTIVWSLSCSESSTGSKPFTVDINDIWIDSSTDMDQDGYHSTVDIGFNLSSNRNATLVAMVGIRSTGGQDPTFYLYKTTESFTHEGTAPFTISLGDEGQEISTGCYDFILQIFLASDLEGSRAAISSEENSVLASICFEEHANDESLIIALENPLFTPMEITLTNYGTKTANPGETVSFIITAQNPGTVNITASTYGKTSVGDLIGSMMGWDFNLDVSGLSTVSRQLGLTQDYIFYYVNNSSATNLTPFWVNYESVEQTEDNIFFPNDSQTYSTGYYRAYGNTKIAAGIQGTQNIVLWDEATQNFIPWTENQSVLLTYAGGLVIPSSDPISNKGPVKAASALSRVQKNKNNADQKNEIIYGKEIK